MNDRNSEPNGLRRVWRVIRIVLVAAMLVGLVFVAKPGQLYAELVRAEWLWLLMAIPFGLLAALLDGCKLYLLIAPHGYRGGFLSVLRTNLVVNFVSLFLPGTIGGGAVAWHRLSKGQNLRAQAFTAVSFNALLKLTAIFMLGALALAVDTAATQSHGRLVIPLAAAAVICALFLLLVLTTELAAWFARGPLKAFDGVLPAIVHGAIRKVFESVSSYRAFPGHVLGALGAAVGRKLVENFCFVLALRAAGVDAPYVRVLWVMCAVETSGMIPLTLSGWGLPQVTFVGLFAAFGVASGASLASQILVILVFLPVYLAGAAVMVLETRKDSPESG